MCDGDRLGVVLPKVLVKPAEFEGLPPPGAVIREGGGAQTEVLREIVQGLDQVSFAARLVALARLGPMKIAFHQFAQRVANRRKKPVTGTQNRIDFGPSREEREKISRVAGIRARIADEFRQEGDHHAQPPGPLAVHHSVQLQIVHHNYVSPGKLQNAVPHPEAPVACGRHVDLQPLVPVEAQHAREAGVGVELDNEREARIEVKLVVPALIDHAMDIERLGRQIVQRL